MRDRGVEFVALIEAANLRLVGEQDIDLGGDQVAEGGAVPVHAERIGERQRHPPPGRMRRRRRLPERALGGRRVEQITFQVGNGGVGN